MLVAKPWKIIVGVIIVASIASCNFLQPQLPKTATNVDPFSIDLPKPYPTPSLPSDIKALTAMAASGDPVAQCMLGRDYEHGTGVFPNSSLARKWLTRSAAQHDGCGINGIGNLFFRGYGVPQDLGMAQGYYEAAALTGYAGAYYNLGMMYKNGEGVPVDERIAIEWLTKAAIGNYAAAYDDLANIYAFGHQFRTHNVGLAVHYYRLALTAPGTTASCKCAREDAAQNLAFLYLNVYHGDDRWRYQEVLHLLKSTSNSSWSKYQIGQLYVSGVGVTKNIDTAALWFKKSADQGYAPAASRYAAYLSGFSGRPVRRAEELRYLELAIVGGDPDGMYQLAEMKWRGLEVPVDHSGAIQLMTAAAAGGSLIAIVDLANRYFAGVGVPRDRYKAYVLFHVAVDVGGTWGPGLRQRLDRQLTDAQRQSAQFEIKRMDQTVLTAMDEQTDLPPIPSSSKTTE
jgi:TPR repeat protein